MKTTMKSSSSSFQQVATPEACFTLEEYDHVGENVPNKLGWEDIQTLSVLGSGAHSKVVLVVDEQRLHHRYALKCLDPTKLLTPSDFCFAAEDLAMEADLLSKLNHKNIVQLRGVSRSSVSDSYFHAANTNYNDNRNEGYFILLDVLEETLHDRIQRWRRDIKQQQIHKSSALCKIFGFGKSNNNNKTQTIVNHQLGRIETVAIGVADAMKYLHDNNIVVRDLKSKNVGFDKEANVRLFDFGMARDVDDCQPGELCGTLRYMAPEVLRGEACGLYSDVYSFGLLLWEVLSLRVPYYYDGGLKRSSDALKFIQQVAHTHARPPLDSKMIPCESTRRLIQDCWDLDYLKRPTFQHICARLRNIVLDGKQPPILEIDERSAKTDIMSSTTGSID
jgi:serine/threonine protein kinase